MIGLVVNGADSRNALVEGPVDTHSKGDAGGGTALAAPSHEEKNAVAFDPVEGDDSGVGGDARVDLFFDHRGRFAVNLLGGRNRFQGGGGNERQAGLEVLAKGLAR